MTYLYNLYCQTISLPFPCEFLPPAEARTVPDVTVAYGAVPRDLTGAVASGENRQLGYAWQAARDRFLFKGGVGRPVFSWKAAVGSPWSATSPSRMNDSSIISCTP